MNYLCIASFNADSSKIIPRIRYNKELDTYRRRLLPINAPRIDPEATDFAFGPL
jgi:hypothetical protein